MPVNSAIPSTMGTHPPCASFTTLALKKSRSTVTNTAHSAPACHAVHRKRMRATR